MPPALFVPSRGSPLVAIVQHAQQHGDIALAASILAAATMNMSLDY
jgi:hypothetical protein